MNNKPIKVNLLWFQTDSRAQNQKTILKNLNDCNFIRVELKGFWNRVLTSKPRGHLPSVDWVI